MKVNDIFWHERDGKIVSDRVLAIVGNELAYNRDGGLGYRTVDDCYSTKSEALIAAAVESRKSAMNYHKSSRDSHEKAVEKERVAIEYVREAISLMK